MTYTSLLLATIIVAVSDYNIDAAPAPQFYGGVQTLPDGRKWQLAGYQAGPAWGSLSQSSNARGLSSPITYSGGVNAFSPAGSGISSSLAVQPGIGGQGSVRGQFGHQMGDHNAIVFAQHNRNLDKSLRPIGPETNSAGINYSHKNGASAFISGAQTNGSPARGTVGGSIPIVTGENGGISATGQTTFGHGMKPDPQVGIQASYNF